MIAEILLYGEYVVLLCFHVIADRTLIHFYVLCFASGDKADIGKPRHVLTKRGEFTGGTRNLLYENQ